MLRKRMCIATLTAILLISGLTIVNGNSSQGTKPKRKSIHKKAKEIKQIKNVNKIKENDKTDINKEMEIARFEAVKEAKRKEVVTRGGENESDFKYYNIPLSKELQLYYFKKCNEYGLNYKRMLSISYHETDGTFDVNLLSPTMDKGIMAINKSNWNKMKEWGLDVENIPKDNIEAGVMLYKFALDEWSDKYTGDELVKVCLLTYNKGGNGAKNHIKRYGINSNYANKVNEIYGNFDKYFINEK